MSKLGLVPLRNFAIVDAKKKIYRSAQPLYSYEYDWLKNKIGIKRIVNLRNELDHDTSFSAKRGIEVIDVSVPDHTIPTLDQAHEFMNTIRTNKVPILIHCAHGHGRTSLFCVLARIAQGWSLDQALEEQEKVFHYTFRHPKQLKFLKKYFS